MEYASGITGKIERRFSLLPPEEKAAVVSHSAAVRFSDLNKQLFPALGKIRFFEEKYRMNLSEPEEKGLPDNADYEMHEDYIMWHHWNESAQKAGKQIDAGCRPIIGN
ncbi:MAG: hypothetical protein V2I97_22355 [Desulfococcaceae bacterium]|jgi:hypothetical protein|nr:hypothetical protein [Desulfococcaceae bacterium]